MIWKLLLAFQLKHFLCDYPLQFGVMLNKFKRTGWVKGLALHAGIHAISTAFILFKLTELAYYNILLLTALDFIAHFAIDRLKASPKLLGRFKSINDPAVYVKASFKHKLSNALFWYSLGLDQTLHHLTHYLIIFLTLKGF